MSPILFEINNYAQIYKYGASEVSNPEVKDITDRNAVTINVLDICIIVTKVHKTLVITFPQSSVNECAAIHTGINL